jgi:hypothetical protein
MWISKDTGVVARMIESDTTMPIPMEQSASDEMVSGMIKVSILRLSTQQMLEWWRWNSIAITIPPAREGESKARACGRRQKPGTPIMDGIRPPPMENITMKVVMKVDTIKTWSLQWFLVVTP